MPAVCGSCFNDFCHYCDKPLREMVVVYEGDPMKRRYCSQDCIENDEERDGMRRLEDAQEGGAK